MLVEETKGLIRREHPLEGGENVNAQWLVWEARKLGQRVAPISNADYAKTFAFVSSRALKRNISYNDFSGYVVRKKLGEGTYGAVYLVEKKNTGKKYALKLFDVEFDWNELADVSTRGMEAAAKRYRDYFGETFFQKWEGEYGLSDEDAFIEINAAETPTNLLMASYGYGVTSTEHQVYVYSLLEFVEGTSLTKLIFCGEETGWTPTQEQFEKLSYVLFHGLCQLHTANLAHLDINPNNIMFTGKELKLVDYGFSCVFSKPCYWSQSTVNPPEFTMYAKQKTKEEAFAVDVWCAAYSILAVLTIEQNEGFAPPIRDFRPLVLQNLSRRISLAKGKYKLPQIFLDALSVDPKARPRACSVYEAFRKIL
ncbi:serine/threonine protein kinase [Tokyovirus A1]|uniref:serine/threonine protein kinase n=1 Tax=Tokyovirus A1 TaxID=1826170 RepID=UPI0007A9736E|nr:serine/threonine protein kinase [Tokyovirus A1]BAU80178.1 serine/threonine protein kinase [Tokyovirus A1]